MVKEERLVTKGSRPIVKMEKEICEAFIIFILAATAISIIIPMIFLGIYNRFFATEITSKKGGL